MGGDPLPVTEKKYFLLGVHYLYKVKMNIVIYKVIIKCNESVITTRFIVY